MPLDVATVAFGLAARAAVRALTVRARAANAQLIAIKGFHIALLGGDASVRAMGDVDLVVAGRGAHERLLEDIRAHTDWEIGADEDHSVPVRGPFGVALDLHRSPLPRHLGRLDADALLHRARPAPAPLEHVLIPDPTDAAVLALVHFTKDRLGTFGSVDVVDDLLLLQSRGARPDRVASRINDYGVRRAALIALYELERRDARFAAVTRAIAPSRTEEHIARGASAALRALGPRAPRATWWTIRLLPDDATQAARGLLWQTRVSLGRRLLP